MKATLTITQKDNAAGVDFLIMLEDIAPLQDGGCSGSMTNLPDAVAMFEATVNESLKQQATALAEMRQEYSTEVTK